MGEIFLTAFGVAVAIGSVVVGLSIYFLPTIISAYRRLPHTFALGVFNFALGALVLPWIGALVYALRSTTPKTAGPAGPVTVIQNASGPPPPYTPWEPPRPPALPPADDPTWPPDHR